MFEVGRGDTRQTKIHTNQKVNRKITVSEPLEEEKERCSGSYRLAVGFLVIKDESISERPG